MRPNEKHKLQNIQMYNLFHMINLILNQCMLKTGSPKVSMAFDIVIGV